LQQDVRVVAQDGVFGAGVCSNSIFVGGIMGKIGADYKQVFFCKPRCQSPGNFPADACLESSNNQGNEQDFIPVDMLKERQLDFQAVFAAVGMAVSRKKTGVSGDQLFPQFTVHGDCSQGSPVVSFCINGSS
jgi:hypothetical protein